MGKLKALSAILAALALFTLASPSQAQLFGRKDNSNVRVDELEERMRVLTGHIEQLSYQVRELQDQIRRMQEDNEYRFQQLEGGGKPGKRSDAGQPEPPAGKLADSVQTLGTLPAGGSGDGEWGASGGYQNNGSNDGSADGSSGGLPGNGPIDLSALAGGLSAGLDNGGQNNGGQTSNGLPPIGQGDNGTEAAGNTMAGLAPSGDPRADYDRAYSYAVNGQYKAAEEGFRAFIDTYPDDRLAANAQYWLGESLLAQRNYREAADAFLKTYTDHPGSEKSPDSLLKLGLSLNGLGENDAACATFSELLNKYPNAAPAVLDQARDEQRRGKCS
ncbi:tol-pal system protein YbgF [Roseibium aggregatum]|uniref:Cell division coordinator CpoB n=1 Tax=Roseibium aggregatum TaxID=187304 RepID=A0A926S7B5_9HYPH|nr:tol-pal system protein YbgF [Roseibium aggregatum]MBD1547327.1 tol-pal system protein YbgF [Roseibium aggregatum]